jgi:hypothetical protein
MCRTSSLVSPAFTEDARNVVLVGVPGTGKTHLATALGETGSTRHGRRAPSTRPSTGSLPWSRSRHEARPGAWPPVCFALTRSFSTNRATCPPAGGALPFHLCGRWYQHTRVVITTGLDFAEGSSGFCEAR